MQVDCLFVFVYCILKSITHTLLFVFICNRNPDELESNSLHTENNGIEVKTTDSGYMSPPETHLDSLLNINSEYTDCQPVDVIIKGFAELQATDKSSKVERELDTFNSFNYWRLPLPNIEVEPAKMANENQSNDSDVKIASESSETDLEKQTSKLNNDNHETPKPRLEFQDLGISDMDNEEDEVNVSEQDEVKKDEDDLTCNEHFNSSPPNIANQLTGVSSLRFDEDYLQPYSPNMSFEEDTPSAPSPPRSPPHHQVSPNLKLL